MSVPPAGSGPAASHRSTSTVAGAAPNRSPRSPEPGGFPARFAHVLGRRLRDGALESSTRALTPGAACGRSSLLVEPRAGAAGEVPPHASALARVDRRGDGEPDARDDAYGRGTGAVDADLLDPTARHAAMLAPPQVLTGAAAPAAHEAIEAPRALRSLEELLPALVKRIAWAGDRHRGSVRMELGAGAYAGTTLIVHADAGRVRVEVSGAGADALLPRLEERLRRRGLDVDSVT